MPKKYIKNFLGKIGKNKQLILLLDNNLLSRYDKGWIKQEINIIKSKSLNKNGRTRTYIRNPPGKDLAHQKGREKAKGYGYEHTCLQLISNHRIQHKYDNYGKYNKDRPYDYFH